jgi:hypothetical protein
VQFPATVPPVFADVGDKTFQAVANAKKNIVLFGESAFGFAAQQEHK